MCHILYKRRKTNRSFEVEYNLQLVNFEFVKEEESEIF